MNLKILGFLHAFLKNNPSSLCTSPSEKPAMSETVWDGAFPFSLPEQEGVHSEGLLRLFEELSADPAILPHSAVVLRNGRLIAHADWSPYSAAYPHVSHSLAKSVVSLAVGIAVKERYLSLHEKLSDIFIGTEIADGVGNITIRQLLTMSSGIKFNEAGSLYSSDWVKSYLSSELIFESGTEFRYNSMNTFMLSAAICRRTGISLSEYISRRLFHPMGINNFFWETNPNGIEKGGWGLYMGIFDYAKLGQLWLDGGVWHGVRLVPSEWINESSRKQISHKDLCRDGYGYHVWLAPKGMGVIFSGMFGQIVYVYPKERMVIAVTAGSESLFPCGGGIDIITGFFENPNNFSDRPITHFRYAEAAALRRSLAAAHFGMSMNSGQVSISQRLKKLFAGRHAESLMPDAAKILSGVSIKFESNRAVLLPLLIQIMNGCIGGGIGRIAFSSSDGRFFMTVSGGENLKIPLNFQGESVFFEYHRGGFFRACAEADFTEDDEGRPTLLIKLCFVETSCAKIMKFIFRKNGVTLRLSERPQLYTALDEAAALVTPDMSAGMRKTLETILETDTAEHKIREMFEPEIFGRYE